MLLILLMCLVMVYINVRHEEKRNRELALLVKSEWLKHKVQIKRNEFEYYKKRIESEDAIATFEDGYTFLTHDKIDVMNNPLSDIRTALQDYKVSDVLFAFY